MNFFTGGFFKDLLTSIKSIPTKIAEVVTDKWKLLELDFTTALKEAGKFTDAKNFENRSIFGKMFGVLSQIPVKFKSYIDKLLEDLKSVVTMDLEGKTKASNFKEAIAKVYQELIPESAKKGLSSLTKMISESLDLMNKGLSSAIYSIGDIGATLNNYQKRVFGPLITAFTDKDLSMLQKVTEVPKTIGRMITNLKTLFLGKSEQRFAMNMEKAEPELVKVKTEKGLVGNFKKKTKQNFVFFVFVIYFV